MTIFDKIETAIGNYMDAPRGKHIATLFTAAALGATVMLGAHAGADNLIEKTPPSDALVKNCIKDKEEHMRAVMAPTPITLGPAFMEMASIDCLNNRNLREKSIRDNLAYRSYNLLEGIGLTVAALGAIGALAGVAVRAKRELRR